MPKKTSSTSQQVKAAQNATKMHDWPTEAGGYDELTLSIFDKNQTARAFDDWTDSDLVDLARISKMQALVFHEMETLESEGFILMGGKRGNTPIENPRNRAISTATAGITAGLRRLGVTSMSVADKRSQANRRQQEGKAKRTLTDDDIDSLDGSTLM